MPRPVDIFLEAKRVMAERLGIDEDDLVPHADFVDDLGADSLATVELVLALEEAFEIDISPDHAERIRTVKDALDCVVSLYGPRAPGPAAAVEADGWGSERPAAGEVVPIRS